MLFFFRFFRFSGFFVFPVFWFFRFFVFFRFFQLVFLQWSSGVTKSAFLIQLSVHVVIVIAFTSSEGIVRIIAQCTVVFSNGLV